MTRTDVDPPEDVPDAVITALDESTDRQLREIVHYAQQLLRDQTPATEAIEPRAGEELVRMEDHGGYTYVVVERPEETGEGRGPFAYRVTWEPTLGDEGDEEQVEDGRYRWHYLGRVTDGSGGG